MIYSGVQLDNFPFRVHKTNGEAYSDIDGDPPSVYVLNSAGFDDAINPPSNGRGAVWTITLTAAEMTSSNKLVTVYWQGLGIIPGSATIVVETEIDSLSQIGALTGPNSVTLTFEDSNGDPVPLVDFTVVGQGVGRASVNGVSAFGLAAGSYTVVARAAGLLFANTTLTVDGTETLTITGTDTVLAAPSAPDKCRVQGTLYKPSGETVPEGTPVEFILVQPDPAKAGGLIWGRKVIALASALGAIDQELIRTDSIEPSGSTYRVVCKAINLDAEDVELDSGAFDLNDLVE